MNNTELKDVKKEQDERIRLLKSVVNQKNTLADLESQLNQREKQELNKQKINVDLQNEKEKVGLDRARQHTQNLKKLKEYQDKIIDINGVNQVKALPSPKEIVIEPGQSIELADESPTDGITVLNEESLQDVINVVSEELTLQGTEQEESKKIPVIDTFPVKKKFNK